MGNRSKYKKYKKVPRTKNKFSFKDERMRNRFLLGITVLAGGDVDPEKLNINKFSFNDKESLKKFILGFSLAASAFNVRENVMLAKHIQNEYLSSPSVAIEQIVDDAKEVEDRVQGFVEEAVYIERQKDKARNQSRAHYGAEQLEKEKKDQKGNEKKNIAAAAKDKSSGPKPKDKGPKSGPKDKGPKSGPKDKGPKSNPKDKGSKSNHAKACKFSMLHMGIFGGSLLWNALIYFIADVQGLVRHLLWVGSMMIPYVVVVALLRLFPKLRSKIGGIISAVIFAVLTFLLIPIFELVTFVFGAVLLVYIVGIIVEIVPNTLTITWEHEDGTTTTETRFVGDDVESEIRAVEREASSKGYHRKE